MCGPSYAQGGRPPCWPRGPLRSGRCCDGRPDVSCHVNRLSNDRFPHDPVAADRVNGAELALTERENPPGAVRPVGPLRCPEFRCRGKGASSIDCVPRPSGRCEGGPETTLQAASSTGTGWAPSSHLESSGSLGAKMRLKLIAVQFTPVIEPVPDCTRGHFVMPVKAFPATPWRAGIQRRAFREEVTYWYLESEVEPMTGRA